MNTTTHTRRLYMLLALATGMIVMSSTPVAAGVFLAPEGREELDSWIPGAGVDASNDNIPQDAWREDGWVRGGGLKSLSTAGEVIAEDGWVRGGGLKSLTAPETRLPVDGWAIGQGMRSQTTQTPTAVTDAQPAPRSLPVSAIILGLLLAAALGVAAAVAARHRTVPSAH